MNTTLHAIFPTSVYVVNRDSNLSSKEEIEIGEIVKEGMYRNSGNYT